MSSKLQSRKFWICVAAGLASLGTGIAGLAQGNETLALVGGICTVVSAAIYAFCEAWVDSSSANSNQTVNQTVSNTSVSASSSNNAVVKEILAPTSAPAAEGAAKDGAE